MRVLLLFLDGVGIGPADPSRNPFLLAHLPALAALLEGQPPVGDVHSRIGPRATLVALDAGLGVPGLPQSGTGQAALFTGENAPRLHGRHFGPWVPTTLRELVRTRSLLARAREAGRAVAFANAYPEELLTGRPTGRAQYLRAGPPLAALGANLLVRHTEALRGGNAIASEIVNDGWREHLGRTDLPDISAHQAGVNLARIAAGHDLTLFAHYSTDTAGHERAMPAAVAALERVDALLQGLLANLPPDVLLVIASDHGNIEDIEQGHTGNPALGIVSGRGHAELAAPLAALTDVAPMILRVLDVP